MPLISASRSICSFVFGRRSPMLIRGNRKSLSLSMSDTLRFTTHHPHSPPLNLIHPPVQRLVADLLEPGRPNSEQFFHRKSAHQSSSPRYAATSLPYLQM